MIIMMMKKKNFFFTKHSVMIARRKGELSLHEFIYTEFWSKYVKETSRLEDLDVSCCRREG